MNDVGLPCVHCGLCLDTCATYRVLGTEADSPRGRIYIMESIERGESSLDSDAAEHLSRCLGCLACESACPSGVSFARRIDAFRPRLAARHDATATWKNLARRAYSSPKLVDAGLATAAIADRLGLQRARRAAPALGLVPGAAADAADPSLSPLRRSRALQPLRARARVALLTGCIGDRLVPEINRDAVEVLQHNGAEVVEVAGQGCCGALALHGGRREEAAELARANVRAFADADVDFIVTTAAGCGAMLGEYDEFLAGDALEADARSVARRSRDVCELLVELGIEAPATPIDVGGDVAYHDPCHLLHARGIASAPRDVCRIATGKPPVDLGENSVCCGSAGSYNLDQPRIADALGRRKAELAAERGAAHVAVANVGCLLQIQRALVQAGLSATASHPVQLLAEAYRGADGAGDATSR